MIGESKAPEPRIRLIQATEPKIKETSSKAIYGKNRGIRESILGRDFKRRISSRKKTEKTMSEKTVVITEIDGSYRIRNNGISEFTLIGILECLLFDLKTARKDTLPLTKQEFPEQKEIVPEQKETVRESNQAQEPDKKQDSSNREARGKSNVPDLRTRIGNAVKAIRSLGGEVEENVDRTNATDEELQTELEELTNQYKRLKNSKGVSM